MAVGKRPQFSAWASSGHSCLSVLMTWQPVFATGGDPGEQCGSHRALYDLGLEVTCSTVTSTVSYWSHRSTEFIVWGDSRGHEREARIIGIYVDAGYIVHHWPPVVHVPPSYKNILTPYQTPLESYPSSLKSRISSSNSDPSTPEPPWIQLLKYSSCQFEDQRTRVRLSMPLHQPKIRWDK